MHLYMLDASICPTIIEILVAAAVLLTTSFLLVSTAALVTVTVIAGAFMPSREHFVPPELIHHLIAIADICCLFDGSRCSSRIAAVLVILPSAGTTATVLHRHCLAELVGEKLEDFLELFDLRRQLQALLFELLFFPFQLFVDQLLRLSVGLKLRNAVYELQIGSAGCFFGLLGKVELF